MDEQPVKPQEAISSESFSQIIEEKKIPRQTFIKKNYLLGTGIFLVLLVLSSLLFIQKTTNSPKPIAKKSTPPSATPIPVTPTASPSPTLIPISPKISVIPTSSAPTPVPTKSGVMGFKYDRIQILGIHIKRGTCVHAFNFTSTGSTQWHFKDFPPNFPIYWEKTSGAISNGETIEAKLCATDNAQPQGGDMFSGITTYFYDDTSGKEQNIDLSWRIEL